MESKSIGPLTKDHVPKLKELLELYKRIDDWDFAIRNYLEHGLCLAIQQNVGVNVYKSEEFYTFLGIKAGYLNLTPYHYSYMHPLSKSITEETIQPRIEALEKIINYLNN